MMVPVVLLVRAGGTSQINWIPALTRSLVRDFVNGLFGPAEGLAALDGGPVSVALVDHGMAGMSGIEFVRQARQRRPGMPVIYLTSHAEPLVPEGIDPRDRVLTKPYTQPFGAIGPLAFIIAIMAIGTGISTAPWLLPRAAAAPGVYEARKALGWATVFAGLALLTITSVAVFMRDDRQNGYQHKGPGCFYQTVDRQWNLRRAQQRRQPRNTKGQRASAYGRDS